MLKKSNTSEPGFKTVSKCLKIRAHHLCCIQGFQGYGYSPIFVANLRVVISDIKAFPSRPLELISECDVVCESCPGKREFRHKKWKCSLSHYLPSPFSWNFVLEYFFLTFILNLH